jgi:hypothetical protein
MFKTLLLSVWDDLSDVKLAEALDNRTSFRRLRSFSATKVAPERAAFVRCRATLVAIAGEPGSRRSPAGMWTRSYALRRMRWRGLAQARCRFISPLSLIT